MFIIYNILQLLAFPIILPLLPVILLLRRKDWGRISARLGCRLPARAAFKRRSPTFWIHALSVGEVTSAYPLVAGLRGKYPGGTIVVSATTRTGKTLADSLFHGLADEVIDGPLDLLPIVNKYVARIQPDSFILVETDFWPNLLFWLQHHKVPTILVNGRMSGRSFAKYMQFTPFFRPMFQSFSALSLQTEQDKAFMQSLGVAPAKLSCLGNLKLDAVPQLEKIAMLRQFIPKKRTILLCGSTHPGEETLLVKCYAELRNRFPDLYLIIAPRNPGRAKEVQKLARDSGMAAVLRSEPITDFKDLLILDTLGELTSFYGIADLAFIGGSITDDGGHNPIEPALFSIPVIFGPHMEDFQELAETLCAHGGAFRVGDSHEFTSRVSQLLEDLQQREQAGHAARETVLTLRGVVGRHLELIHSLL